MEITVIIFVFILIIGILKVLQNQKGTERGLTKYAYTAKEHVMTYAEKTFYDRLFLAVGSSHYVVPQAHLSMFIDHKIKGQNWKGAFSTINGKSVDFLIVEKETQRPVLAIELDDYTHKQPARAKRDSIVNAILEDAKIPLQHYTNIEQPLKIDEIILGQTTI